MNNWINFVAIVLATLPIRTASQGGSFKENNETQSSAFLKITWSPCLSTMHTWWPFSILKGVVYAV